MKSGYEKPVCNEKYGLVILMYCKELEIIDKMFEKFSDDIYDHTMEGMVED